MRGVGNRGAEMGQETQRQFKSSRSLFVDLIMLVQKEEKLLDEHLASANARIKHAGEQLPIISPESRC